jgi:hypothetical protein
MAKIFSVENQPNKKTTCSREVLRSFETSAHVWITRRYTSRDGNIPHCGCGNLKAYDKSEFGDKSGKLELTDKSKIWGFHGGDYEE